MTKSQTFQITGEMWRPIPVAYSIQAESEAEAKVEMIQRVAKDWGFSEDAVRQYLYIHKREGNGRGTDQPR